MIGMPLTSVAFPPIFVQRNSIVASHKFSLRGGYFYVVRIESC